MNRIVLLACTLMLFSCVKQKDYTCNCTADNTQVKTEKYLDVQKHLAETNCEDLETSLNDTTISHSSRHVMCDIN